MSHLDANPNPHRPGSPANTGSRERRLRPFPVLAMLAGLVFSAISSWAQSDRVPAPPSLTSDEAVLHLSLPGGFTTPPAAGTSRRAGIQVTGARPIVSVELWNGSQRVARKRLRGAPNAWRGHLDWVPAPSGESLLVARAIDDRGHMIQSNVIHHRARGDELRLGTARRTVVARQTLADVAAEERVDPDTLALLNPELALDEPLAEGLEVAVPLVADLPEINPGPPQIAAPPQGRRPGIAVVGVRCRASVLGWAGRGRALALYRLSPNDRSFELVATASGPYHIFQTPLGPGSQAFVVGAYDTALALSPPIVIASDRECGGRWDGGSRLVLGRLTAPTEAPRVYAFIRDAAGETYRVPTEGALDRSEEGYDVREPLPPVTGSELRLTVLAVDEDGEHLVDTSHLVTNGLEVGDVIGVEPTASLAWIERPAAPGVDETLATFGHVPDAGPLFFRWSTNMPAVTHAYWQVFGYQPPEGVLSPAGIVAQGITPVSDGTFEVDFSMLDEQPVTGTVVSTDPPTYGIFTDVTGPSGAPPPPDAVMVAPEKAIAAGLPAITRFFVRVVPLVGESPLGLESNLVEIETGPEFVYENGDVSLEFAAPPVGSVDLEVELLELPAPPLPNYAVCFMFIGWDEDARVDPSTIGWGPYGPTHPFTGEPAPSWYQFYEAQIAGGKVNFCPSSGGSGGLTGLPGVDLIIEIGAGLYKGLSSGFNAFKGEIVDAVTTAVGCTAPECKTVASLALDAALVASGVPPTLPDFESLVQSAKGDLASALVTLATDAIPVTQDACDALAVVGEVADEPDVSCQAAAEAAIDAAVDGFYDAVRQHANSASGMYFPPGMRMVPDPLSVPKPARVAVTLSVEPGVTPPIPDTCSVKLAIFGDWSTSPYNQTIGLPPTFDPFRATHLPVHADRETRVPTYTKTIYIPDGQYAGAAFQSENRLLPELPLVGPVSVTETFYLHRPIEKPAIQGFRVIPPNLPTQNPLLITVPESVAYESLVLHQPNLFEQGAKLVATAYSVCGGFDFDKGGL